MNFLLVQMFFEKLSEEEIGTFYLTDYLVKNFNRIMIKGLGP